MKVKVIRNYQITISAKIRKKLNIGSQYLIVEEDEKIML
jgi:AbrB family looped-hinge helix DNA binding protein